MHMKIVKIEILLLCIFYHNRGEKKHIYQVWRPWFWFQAFHNLVARLLFFLCSDFLYCEVGMGIFRSFRRRVKDILNSFESTEFLCEWTVWWFYEYLYKCASLIAQLVKNPPAMQETPVQFLGQEYPLEKG